MEQQTTNEANEFEQQSAMKHRKKKKTSDDKDAEIMTLQQRIIELEKLHPELKPKQPASFYTTLGKWILCIIIIGIFLYGIYLFLYWYEYLGKDITIPFIGILRH